MIRDHLLFLPLRLWDLLGSLGVYDIYCEMLYNLDINNSSIISFENIPIDQYFLYTINTLQYADRRGPFLQCFAPAEIDN